MPGQRVNRARLKRLRAVLKAMVHRGMRVSGLRQPLPEQSLRTVVMDSDAVERAATSDPGLLRAAWPEHDVDPRAFSVGVFLGQELIGVGWCGPQWKSLGIEELFVAALFVVPKRRGRGVCQRCIGALLHESMRRGEPAPYTLVDSVNLPSLAAAKRARARECNPTPKWMSTIEQHLRRNGQGPQVLLTYGQERQGSRGTNGG